MTAIIWLCGVILAASAGLALVATLRARTVADRSVALDVVVSIALCVACAAAVYGGSGTFSDVALALALVGFIGALAAGRFIDRRGL